MLMKKLSLSLALIVGVAAIGLLFRYGTLSPCGMLKKELRSDVLHSAIGQTSTSNKWEMAGRSLGAMLAGPMIDSLIESLTPMECARGLVKYHTEGKNIFSDRFGSKLEGYGDISSSYSKPTEPKKPVWYSYTKQSPIDDSTNVYLSIDANKSISGWLNKNVTPSLHIRCKENKTNVYINLGMRPKTEYGSYGAESAYLRLRYDDEKAYKEKFSLSTDGEAVFFSSYIPSIKKMLKHKSLLIEFTPYNSSPQMTTFDLVGLDEKIGPLREACHW